MRFRFGIVGVWRPHKSYSHTHMCNHKLFSTRDAGPGVVPKSQVVSAIHFTARGSWPWSDGHSGIPTGISHSRIPEFHIFIILLQKFNFYSNFTPPNSKFRRVCVECVWSSQILALSSGSAEAESDRPITPNSCWISDLPISYTRPGISSRCQFTKLEIPEVQFPERNRPIVHYLSKFGDSGA